MCFDVVDACMSWVRALSLVDSLFKTGAYKNAIIVNAEFNMIRNGPLFPANFALSSEDQIAYTFPSYSIGEAATATLLLPKEPDNFEFHFSTRPELSDLCTIPLEGYEEYCHPDERIGKNDILRFTSFGESLHREGHPEAVSVFRKLRNGKDADIVFVHGSSKKEWETVGIAVGVSDIIHHIFPKTGNLVSASVPAAINDALHAGKLVRGDKIAICVGSAGMSFNATSCVF
jgi:acyl-CoA:acyl-CoA alkyltransferase